MKSNSEDKNDYSNLVKVLFDKFLTIYFCLNIIIVKRHNT